MFIDRGWVFRYHIPRSWLKQTQNLLVILEELGGNPMKTAIVKRSVTTVCADVSEFHPTLKNWQIESFGKSEEFHNPKVHLRWSSHFFYKICKLWDSFWNMRKLPTGNLPCSHLLLHPREGNQTHILPYPTQQVCIIECFLHSLIKSFFWLILYCRVV